MGLDLILLPFDHNSFSHTVLSCQRNYQLFDWIQTLPALEVESGFQSYVSRDDKYEDTHYGETLETPYGDVVLYTTIKHLKNVPKEIENGFDKKTQAIWAYLRHLDNSNKVALFWH